MFIIKQRHLLPYISHLYDFSKRNALLHTSLLLKESGLLLSTTISGIFPRCRSCFGNNGNYNNELTSLNNLMILVILTMHFYESLSVKMKKQMYNNSNKRTFKAVSYFICITDVKHILSQNMSTRLYLP